MEDVYQRGVEAIGGSYGMDKYELTELIYFLNSYENSSTDGIEVKGRMANGQPMIMKDNENIRSWDDTQSETFQIVWCNFGMSELHRLDGPAVSVYDPETFELIREEWWVDGNRKDWDQPSMIEYEGGRVKRKLFYKDVESYPQGEVPP
jgi:hypothetical protein